MKKLTRTEEEIMQIIWKLERCTVRDIREVLGEPKPPHSTVSSVVRILENKGFLSHKAYGKTYEYFPIIEKEDYSRLSIKNLVQNYFEGSVNRLVSFLVQEENLKPKEIEELLEKLDKKDK